MASNQDEGIHLIRADEVKTLRCKSIKMSLIVIDSGKNVITVISPKSYLRYTSATKRFTVPKANVPVLRYDLSDS